MTVDVTRMSRNGQVVIPKDIRDKLGLRAGDALLAAEVEGRIVLAPARGEAIRAEFEGVLAEFDRALADVRDVDAVEAVRRVRDARGRREG